MISAARIIDRNGQDIPHALHGLPRERFTLLRARLEARNTGAADATADSRASEASRVGMRMTLDVNLRVRTRLAPDPTAMAVLRPQRFDPPRSDLLQGSGPPAGGLIANNAHAPWSRCWIER